MTLGEWTLPTKARAILNRTESAIYELDHEQQTAISVMRFCHWHIPNSPPYDGIASSLNEESTQLQLNGHPFNTKVTYRIVPQPGIPDSAQLLTLYSQDGRMLRVIIDSEYERRRISDLWFDNGGDAVYCTSVGAARQRHEINL